MSATGLALSQRVIGLAMEVHRHLGPGLLESAYEQCLCYELQRADIAYHRQVSVPVSYKGVQLDCGYRMDVLVERELVLEIKATEKLIPLHEAQLLSYLRLANMRVGLLMNFNSILLKDGIRRMVND
ncbi:MAG: GxxExxY protein [Alphaproteobacteria bacterium]|nr:GxxExxY protein [Alphaproteobacteria bacterium]